MMKIIFSLIVFCSLSFSCKEELIIIEEEQETKDLLNDSSPNIVVILIDDMGWDAFGSLEGISSTTKANTPTLDSLANAGVTFSNFWVNPVCSPTRAAMLTGKYGFRTGVGGVASSKASSLGDNETILHKYIKDNSATDYATAIIGKWHLHQRSDTDAPNRFGVDYFSGFMGGGVNDYFNWTQIENGQSSEINTYTTTHFVDKSIDWIGGQNTPFFLWLAFNAPHTPFHRPPLELINNQSLSDLEAEINNEPLGYYLAAIEAIDTEVKRLISSMTTEQKANTTFIIMGDNGTPNQVAQNPYSRSTVKGSLYQGGVNTPLFIAGNAVTNKGVNASLIQATDVFTTIADLTISDVPTYEDGLSFKSQLVADEVLQRDFIYTELFSDINGAKEGYCIRNTRYKYISLTNGNELFFDLESDPFEQNELLVIGLSNSQNEALEQIKSFETELKGQ